METQIKTAKEVLAQIERRYFKGAGLVKGSKLKTITFSSVNPADGCEPEHKDHTWVEGIGDLSQPIAGWKPNSLSMLNSKYFDHYF